MSDNSKIEWTDATWNPIDGCTKVSEGCRNCYAERIAKRFWKGRKFGDIKFHADRLEQPLHWKEPRMIFVCSMGDLFHENVPNDIISKIFTVMMQSKQHIFQILTKRPKRMWDYWSTVFWKDVFYKDHHAAPSNVWPGTTVENQPAADERIPWLLKIPAAVRFASIEPMLEQQDIYQYLGGNREIKSPHPYNGGLDWVICGAESGQSARPFNEDWARNLKDQCVNAGVPFFYKQGRDANGKLVKMPVLDGRVWDEYPDEYPQRAF